jgi:hypothetical protein
MVMVLMDERTRLIDASKFDQSAAPNITAKQEGGKILRNEEELPMQHFGKGLE